MIEVVPTDVDGVARAWDEQHLDLRSAATQVRDAPTDGFTADVRLAAGAFLLTWEGLLGDLATAAEARADGLRTTLVDYLATDLGVSRAFASTLVPESR